MKSHEVKEKSNKTVFLRSFWAGKPLRICLNKHILGWIAFSNCEVCNPQFRLDRLYNTFELGLDSLSESL